MLDRLVAEIGLDRSGIDAGAGARVRGRPDPNDTVRYTELAPTRFKSLFRD